MGTTLQVFTSSFAQPDATAEDGIAEYPPKMIFNGPVDFGRGGRPSCSNITLTNRRGQRQCLRVLDGYNSLDVTEDSPVVSVIVATNLDVYNDFDAVEAANEETNEIVVEACTESCDPDCAESCGENA